MNKGLCRLFSFLLCLLSFHVVLLVLRIFNVNYAKGWVLLCFVVYSG